MNIVAFLIFDSKCVNYSLSADKKTFTAFVSVEGVPEELAQETVQESKVHTGYITAIIKEGISALNSECFKGCTSLKSVTLASTVSFIRNKAFYGCTSLIEIEFPPGVKEIHDEVMRDCSSLTKVTFPSSLESIGILVFMFTNVNEFNIAYNKKFTTNKEKTLLIENETTIKVIAPGVREITVPKEIITLARDSMSYTSKLTKIYFEEGSKLETVSSRAFCQTGLTSIELPYGTLRILYNAFLQASNLKSLFFPSTLIEVDITCIANTGSLNNVTVGSQCKALELDSYGVIYITSDYSILFMPKDITNFTIPNKTSQITERTLQTRKKLTSIETKDENHPKFLVYNNTLYDKKSMALIAGIGGAKIVNVHPNCTSIMPGAFNSIGVEEVNMKGTNITKIQDSVFGSTTNLRVLYFSEVLETLSSWVFSATGLRSLIFPSSLTSFLDNIITRSQVTLVDLSKCSKLKSINNRAFTLGYKLHTIKFPEFGSNIMINPFSFDSCSSLSKITIEPSIVSILDNAFQNSNITEIEFKEGCKLEHIGPFSFYNCKLVSIKIPDSVGEIEENAFSGCNKLISVEFGQESKLKAVSPFVFKGCKLESIKLGKHLQEIYECGFSGCETLQNIEISNDNQNFSSIEGCVYSKDKSIFIACPPGLQSVEINKDTSSISGSAFYECKKLKKIKFDEESAITEIGSSTFYGCELLSNLFLPKKIKALRKECLKRCKNLEYVIFPNDCEIEIIEKSACSESGLHSIDFRGCKLLKILSESIFEDCWNLDSVYLPPMLNNIESNCFKNCRNLGYVEFCSIITPEIPFIPKIEEGAFDGCNGLKRIIVPIQFPQDTIGGLQANRILDSDCKHPTVLFSKPNTNSISPMFFFYGEITEGE